MTSTLVQNSGGNEPAKSRAVWLDMSQAELDAAYDQLVYAPNYPQVLQRSLHNSKLARARLRPSRYSYGTSPIEGLDVYRTAKVNGPINIFIHGGAWLQRKASGYTYLAESFVRAGAHFVALDFAGVDTTNGNLLPIMDQVRRAIAWVYQNAKSFGGDPTRIYLSGQSSGAHLAANAVTTNWEEWQMPSDIIKGALLCSGIYDLKPVRLSKRSEYVAFTDEIEEALSSQRHLKWLNCPVIVAYGTLETPEFQRQSRDFAAAVSTLEKPVTLLVGEGYNHFEMTELIGHPFSVVGAAVLEQMKLSLSFTV